MKHLASIGFILILIGCTINVITGQISHIVAMYCQKSQEEREAIRTLVASKIAPNRLVIECAGDDD